MVRLLKAVSVLTLSVVLLSGCSAGWPAAAPTAFPSVSAKPGDVVKPNFAYRVAYEDQWLRIVNDSPLDRYKVPKDLKPSKYLLEMYAKTFDRYEARYGIGWYRLDGFTHGEPDAYGLRTPKLYFNDYGIKQYPEFKDYNYYQQIKIIHNYAGVWEESATIVSKRWGLTSKGITNAKECSLDLSSPDVCQIVPFDPRPRSERIRHDFVMLMENWDPLTRLSPIWEGVRQSMAAKRPFKVQGDKVVFTDKCGEGCKFAFNDFPLKGRVGVMNFEIKVKPGTWFAEFRQSSKGFQDLMASYEPPFSGSQCAPGADYYNALQGVLDMRTLPLYWVPVMVTIDGGPGTVTTPEMTKLRVPGVCDKYSVKFKDYFGFYDD